MDMSKSISTWQNCLLTSEIKKQQAIIAAARESINICESVQYGSWQAAEIDKQQVVISKAKATIAIYINEKSERRKIYPKTVLACSCRAVRALPQPPAPYLDTFLEVVCLNRFCPLSTYGHKYDGTPRPPLGTAMFIVYPNGLTEWFGTTATTTATTQQMQKTKAFYSFKQCIVNWDI